MSFDTLKALRSCGAKILHTLTLETYGTRNAAVRPRYKDLNFSTYSRCQRAELGNAGKADAPKLFPVVMMICRRFGGASRDRTDDLRLAKAALSQLSYGPLLVKSSVSTPLSASHPNATEVAKVKWWA